MTPDSELRFLHQPEIRGLSKKLITDLHDIVDKFGRGNPEDRIIRFSSSDFEIDQPLHLSKSVQNGNGTLLVFKSTVPRQGLYPIETTRGVVLWDKSLEASEAKSTVAEIDKVAEQLSLFDPKTGDRKPLPPELRFMTLGKMKVEEVFSDQGTFQPILPDNDPQKLLDAYDHPEQLIIINDDFGYPGIAHVKDVEYFQKRRVIVLEILEERGIDISNKEEMVNKLSIELIMELRTEIEKRMQEKI